MEDEEYGLVSNGHSPHLVSLYTFESDVAAATVHTVLMIPFLLQVDEDCSLSVLGLDISVGSGTESVVHKARGHRGPPSSLVAQTYCWALMSTLSRAFLSLQISQLSMRNFRRLPTLQHRRDPEEPKMIIELFALFKKNT
jgi:hypothetical protein